MRERTQKFRVRFGPTGDADIMSTYVSPPGSVLRVKWQITGGVRKYVDATSSRPAGLSLFRPVNPETGSFTNRVKCSSVSSRHTS